MKKLTIQDIEEIEERRSNATVGDGDRLEYTLLVEHEIPRLIADNKRLRKVLNKLAGVATKAVS